ncbi:hypothetical protein FRC17_001648 [Serendipita sp. 399]|nr:hypothetical protein FRC17_001648 [Serendipita sp. 399]
MPKERIESPSGKASGSSPFKRTTKTKPSKGKGRASNGDGSSLPLSISSPTSKVPPFHFDPTPTDGILQGYEESSPLSAVGHILTSPPIELALPSPNQNAPPHTPHHDHQSNSPVATSSHQDTKSTSLSLDQTLQVVFKLLLKRMGPLAANKEARQKMQTWFSDAPRILYWKPEKPLGCAECFMPVKNVDKMAKHLYQCHSPWSNHGTVTCCGCVFSGDTQWRTHVERDHYKQLIRLVHLDYSGLTEAAQAIHSLDDSHFSLVESLSGNNPTAKGRMLNLIAEIRERGRPLLVLKRVKGIRINNRVRRLCCGICGIPRCDVQEMALHVNSEHLKHQGFECPIENCLYTCSALDRLRVHCRKTHSEGDQIQWKNTRQKVDSKRKITLGSLGSPDGEATARTRRSGQDPRSMSTSSSSSSSASPSSPNMPMFSDRQDRTLPQQPQFTSFHPIGMPASSPALHASPMTSHGHLDVPGPVATQNSHPFPPRSPVPIHQHPHRQANMMAALEHSTHQNNASPPYHIHAHGVASQIQSPLDPQPNPVELPPVPDDELIRHLRQRINAYPLDFARRILLMNPSHPANGDRCQHYSERDRALCVLLDVGIAYSQPEIQSTPLQVTLDAAREQAFHLHRPMPLIDMVISPTTASSFASPPPASPYDYSDRYYESQMGRGSQMQSSPPLTSSSGPQFPMSYYDQLSVFDRTIG